MNDINELRHFGTKGMKWYVRRYQNKDGSLTEAGKRRYQRDILDDNAKKKDNRIKDVEKNPDPYRWLREDTSRKKDLRNAQLSAVKDLQKIVEPNEEKRTRIANERAKVALADMTDDDIRQLVNRRTLEQNYMRLYSEDYAPTVSRGRQSVNKALEIAGTVLTLSSSAISVALAIQQLKAGRYGGATTSE